MTARKPLLVALLLAGACVDPKARLTDFENNVVDAAPIVTIDAMPLDELPDISGYFYVAISPTPSPNTPFTLYWETELTKNGDGTGTLKITSTWITTQANGSVRTGTPTVLDNIPVSKSGEFMAHFDMLALPGIANGITGGDLVVNLFYRGTIKDVDTFCGILDAGSKVVSPSIPVDGSTWAGVRVAKDAEGAQLPSPVMACPVEMPDAGMPDAGEPDAGEPDAGLDAALPDAT